MNLPILLLVIISLAVVFDFINGFHDAANSIATIVSTKVLTPLQAVIWAAFFNFVAFFLFRDHGVANTVAKTVHKEAITLIVILSGIIAAIFWNLLTWWYGIPSSSSHTLIGGFAGAAIAHSGFQSIDAESILKTTIFIVLAPLIGMVVSIFITLVTIQRSFFKKICIIPHAQCSKNIRRIIHRTSLVLAHKAFVYVIFYQCRTIKSFTIIEPLF